jgi:hypothetical protein
MRRNYTLEDIKKSAVAPLNKHLFEDEEAVEEEKKKRSKYSNVKVETEDGVFDSKKEAKRFRVLRKRLKKGEIGQLARQVEYELNAGGSHSMIYKADFVYIETATGLTIVEDVKGFRTAVYEKKKRLMKKLFKIEITEI